MITEYKYLDHTLYRNEKGELHNEFDYPAVIYKSGTKFWFKNGIKHRENGLPANIYYDGSQDWVWYGKPYTHYKMRMESHIAKGSPNWKTYIIPHLKHDPTLIRAIFKIHFPQLLSELDKLALLC